MSSSRFWLNFVCWVFGGAAFAIVVCTAFGPILYAVLAKKLLGVEFDTNAAIQFTNNLVSSGAIWLSVVAIVATLIGLNWQFQQTETTAKIERQLGEVREEVREMRGGKRTPVIKLASKSGQEYKKEEQLGVPG